jgi:hypothetical protein
MNIAHLQHTAKAVFFVPNSPSDSGIRHQGNPGSVGQPPSLTRADPLVRGLFAGMLTAPAPFGAP